MRSIPFCICCLCCSIFACLSFLERYFGLLHVFSWFVWGNACRNVVKHPPLVPSYCFQVYTCIIWQFSVFFGHGRYVLQCGPSPILTVTLWFYQHYLTSFFFVAVSSCAFLLARPEVNAVSGRCFLSIGATVTLCVDDVFDTLLSSRKTVCGFFLVIRRGLAFRNCCFLKPAFANASTVLAFPVIGGLPSNTH